MRILIAQHWITYRKVRNTELLTEKCATLKTLRQQFLCLLCAQKQPFRKSRQENQTENRQTSFRTDHGHFRFLWQNVSDEQIVEMLANHTWLPVIELASPGTKFMQVHTAILLSFLLRPLKLQLQTREDKKCHAEFIAILLTLIINFM